MPSDIRRKTTESPRFSPFSGPVGGAAPWVVAGAVLLTTGETTLAQGTAVIATEGAGPLGLGALVGAIVAGGYALVERFRQK